MSTSIRPLPRWQSGLRKCCGRSSGGIKPLRPVLDFGPEDTRSYQIRRVRMERQIEATPSPVARGMSTFFLLWFGQTISLLGTGLTGFALGVWVFNETHSATALTLIAFFGVLPVIVFSPLAGALVDRWDRRWALI